MTKRNENRKSTVKGIIANPETQTFEAFEIETPYTRSIPKAAEMARKVLNLEDGVMVSVTEIHNEALKPVIYDSQEVFDEMVADYETKEEAEENCNELCTVIPYTMYQYEAQVWLFDGDKYATEFFSDNSPMKFGKVDTRGFIRMAAESFFDSKVIGIHDDKRYEEKRFAIVENDRLEFCIKK